MHLLHARQAARLAVHADGTQPSNGTQPGNGTRPSDGTQSDDGVTPEPVLLNEKPQPPATAAAPRNGSTQPPARDAGVTAIGQLNGARKAVVEGKVRSVEIHPVENSCVFDATVADETGALTAKFYGRRSIPGFAPGTRVRLAGKVSMREGGPAMINPAYELLPRGE